MTVIVRHPGAPLAGVVDSISYQAGETPETVRDTIMPDGQAAVWVNLNQDEFTSYPDPDRRTARRVPGAMVAGAYDRECDIEIEAARSHISVTFTVGAAKLLIGAPLSLLRNEMAGLEDLWGREGRFVRERLLACPTPADKLSCLEAVLRQRLRNAPPPDAGMVFAAAGLASGARLRDVHSQTGLLPRTFRRRFLDQVGLTPKRFARVQRLQRTLRCLHTGEDVEWAGVAAANGYCDQSHLIDDFRELAGLTPTRYLRLRMDGPNHLRLPPIGAEVPTTAT
jgi:AraC-like DNA-binding protein